MNFKSFNIKISIRVVLITINCYFFIWAIEQEHLEMAKISLGLLILIQTMALIAFINNKNQRFFRFMELIKHQAFMEKFSEKEEDGSSKKLLQAYNEIIELISNFKFEKEGQELYFYQTLEIIGTSIIAVDENNDVDLINKSARQLLKIGNIKNIREIKHVHPDFINKLKELKHNEQSVFKLISSSSIRMLSIKCIQFKNLDKQIKLYSFQDISTELENEELEAWQKLIRVLRHEIMNSVTPISSLTNTIIRLLSDNGSSKSIEDITPETIQNTLEGLYAIEKRNKGLLAFVESYRNLTNIPKPIFENIELTTLFDDVRILLNESFNKQGIEFLFEVKPSYIKINADEKLITQVIINLLNNAIESFENTPNAKISLQATEDANDQVQIKITDNGKGIAPEDLENIFIPFYTTKRKGSGIGLSLSRQILRLHKASISVSSTPGKGSEFIIHI